MWPHRPASPGQSIDGDDIVGVVGSGLNVVPSPDGGSGSAVGADSDTASFLGMGCVNFHIEPGGDNVFHGWTFEHANLLLGPASEVGASGYRVEGPQAVAILEFWFAWQQAGFVYDVGRAGIFFVAPTTGISDQLMPGGPNPQAYCGLEVVPDGGQNSLRYGAYDNTGAVLDTGVPSAGLVQPNNAWNYARLVLVGTTGSSPARMLECEINGEQVAGPVAFGSAQLESPSTINSSTHGMLSMVLGVRNTGGGVNRDMFTRWRLRTGRFTAAGVEVT